MNDDQLSPVFVRETEEDDGLPAAAARPTAPVVTPAEAVALRDFRLRETVTLPIEMIDVGERLRPVDPEEVAQIAASMREVGQITPIEVTPLLSGRYQLVIGAHRFAAVTELGGDAIEAVIVTDQTDDQLRLREIDENLYRHELNPLDQAVFLAERQAIYLRIHPETKKGGYDRKAISANSALMARAPSFAADVAKKIGLAKRTVQLALTRHDDLSPEVRALIRGTWIAKKGSALDALKDVPKAAQVKVARALLSPAADRPRTVREARQMVLREQPADPKPGKSPLDRAKSAIEHLSVEERLQLVAWMGNRGYVAQPGKAKAT